MALANRVFFTKHAFVQMDRRNVGEQDVMKVLVERRRVVRADQGRWKVWGTDRTGDILGVVVAIENDLIVVTVTGE